MTEGMIIIPAAITVRNFHVILSSEQRIALGTALIHSLWEEQKITSGLLMSPQPL